MRLPRKITIGFLFVFFFFSFKTAVRAEVWNDCGAFWTKNSGNGQCYRATAARQWMGARDACSAWDGYLVTVNDGGENAWLRSTFGGGGFWIGYNDRGSEGNWRWVGEGSSYTNWHPGEPNDCCDGEDCGMIWSPGTWNDASCIGVMPGVCEKSPVCTPSCNPPYCGQADGCGGTCSSSDIGNCPADYSPYCGQDKGNDPCGGNCDYNSSGDCGQFPTTCEQELDCGQTYSTPCQGVSGQRCSGSQSTTCSTSDCSQYDASCDSSFIYSYTGGSMPLKCGQWRENVCLRDYSGGGSSTITLTQTVSEGGTASLTCPAGMTISSYTSVYGKNCGSRCCGGAGCPCGSCSIGASSCSVTYNNTNCGDCAVGCGKNGDLSITCGAGGGTTCSQERLVYCLDDHCDDYDIYGSGSLTTNPCGVTKAQCGQSYSSICVGASREGCSPDAQTSCIDNRAGELTKITYPDRQENHCDLRSATLASYSFPHLCRHPTQANCSPSGGEIESLTNRVFLTMAEEITVAGKAYIVSSSQPIAEVKAKLGGVVLASGAPAGVLLPGSWEGSFSLKISGAKLAAGENTIEFWARPSTSGLDTRAVTACLEYKIASIKVKRLPNISGTIWQTGIHGLHWSPCGMMSDPFSEGTEIELVAPSGLTNCDDETESDAQGKYSFVGLWPSTNSYLVKMIRPEGWEITCGLEVEEEGVIKAVRSVSLSTSSWADKLTEDFGVWKNLGPWFVTEGGDLHAGSLASGGISSKIPATCTSENRCFWDYYQVKGMAPRTTVPSALSLDSRFDTNEPGVVSCQDTVDTGSGSLSSTGWLFTSSGFDTERIRYDYAYFQRLFANLRNCSEAGEFNCVRNRDWDGTTKPVDGPGFYICDPDPAVPGDCNDGDGALIGGDALIDDWTDTADFGAGPVSTNWVISNEERITLIVDGDVKIKNGIRLQKGMLTIVARGDIYFHKTIVSGDWDEATETWTDTGERIGGIFVADGQIISCADDQTTDWEALGTNDCLPFEDPDNPAEIVYPQILFGGLFTGWGGFNLGRNLADVRSGTTITDLNNIAPAEIFVFIPEFAACLPSCFKRPVHFWTEQLPSTTLPTIAPPPPTAPPMPTPTPTPIPLPTPTATPTPVLAVQIYQASSGFSSTQGQQNWYYQYASLGSDSYGDMSYQTGGCGTTWHYPGSGGDFYTCVANSWGHPGESMDAVRVWQAPGNGTINITGDVSDSHSGCGGGARAIVKKGTQELGRCEFNDGGSCSLGTISTSVASGERIYFRFNKKDGNNSCDTTGWDPRIEFTAGAGLPPPVVSCDSYPDDKFIACVYDGRDFGSQVGQFEESSINHHWGGGGPLGRSDNFSVRWRGNINFSAGNYTFRTVSDDGIRLFVDGQKIIERWSDHGDTVDTASRTMSAGRHQIVLEFYENGGDATAELSW